MLRRQLGNRINAVTVGENDVEKDHVRPVPPYLEDRVADIPRLVDDLHTLLGLEQHP